MNNEQRLALLAFYSAVQGLKDTKVIRTDTLWGDIGEFLCTCVYENLVLEKQKNRKGFDAKQGDSKVQIKFSNSSDAENISLGNPAKYHEVIVVLGAKSKHRKTASPNNDYLFYRYTSQEVIDNFKISNDFTLANGKHFKDHDEVFDLSDNNFT